MRRLHLWLTKEQIVEERLRGAAAVVIDVFLATTTILTILERGARAVIPVAGPEEGRRLVVQAGGLPPITGGEEDGMPIAGFDLGPFPDEYGPEAVRDREVVYSTTNGTRAIRRAEAASPLLLATLRNAPATAAYLRRLDPERLVVICCGSKGRFGLEDFLCATVLLDGLDLTGVELNDAAQLARAFAASRPDVPALLRRSRLGRFFAEHGYDALLAYVGAVGASPSVVAVRDGRAVRIEPEE